MIEQLCLRQNIASNTVKAWLKFHKELPVNKNYDKYLYH